MKHLAALLLVALAVAGCGGDDDEPAATSPAVQTDSSAADDGGQGDTSRADDATESEAAPTKDAPEETDEAPVSDLPSQGEVAPEGTGIVTIGDTTYFFIIPPDGTCDPDFFGSFRAFMTQADESGTPLPSGGLTISAAPSGEGIIGGELDGVLWSVAESDPGSSIDSVEIDGNQLRGTATFVSPELGETQPGSFAVTCPAGS